MSRSNPIPLLICSLGNPGARWANTPHSAGHIILSKLQSSLRRPPFQPCRTGEISVPEMDVKRVTLTGYARSKEKTGYDWTLWKSGSLMNISGPGVKDVWESWRSGDPDRIEAGRLIVLHDELEKDVGKWTFKEGSASAKGHNGIKSIQQVFAGRTPFSRIAIGIGRPESRSPDVVSKYVLRQYDGSELRQMQAIVTQVAKLLQQISEGEK